MKAAGVGIVGEEEEVGDASTRERRSAMDPGSWRTTIRFEAEPSTSEGSFDAVEKVLVSGRTKRGRRGSWEEEEEGSREKGRAGGDSLECGWRRRKKSDVGRRRSRG